MQDVYFPLGLGREAGQIPFLIWGRRDVGQAAQEGLKNSITIAMGPKGPQGASKFYPDNIDIRDSLSLSHGRGLGVTQLSAQSLSSVTSI